MPDGCGVFCAGISLPANTYDIHAYRRILRAIGFRDVSAENITSRILTYPQNGLRFNGTFMQEWLTLDYPIKSLMEYYLITARKPR